MLPFGRPLGRFGVGGPTGSCGERGDTWKPLLQSCPPLSGWFPPAAVCAAVPCPGAEVQEETGRRLFGETALWSHCYSCLGLSTCVEERGHQSLEEGLEGWERADMKQGEGTPSRKRVKGALLLGYSWEEELIEWLMLRALWHEADRNPDRDLANAGET